MPKRGRRFITEFLVPNLNEEKFGARLKWLDRELTIFQMQWNHKAASDWTKEDCQVFVDWDKKRGHYRPEEKEYFTKSKQRFRAVLNKSIQDHEITQLQSDDKNLKIYCLGPGDTIPDGIRLDIVKDNILNDKSYNHLNDKSNVKSDSTNSTSSLEQGQVFRTNIYCNALKDHNYQYNEHKIPESDNSTSYDALKNELSLYSSDNENVSTCFNILEPTNDKVSLENFFLPENVSLPDFDFEELNLLLENRDQYLHLAESNLSANSTQQNSSGISVKRSIEHSDVGSIKKSKLMMYVEKAMS